MKMQKNHGFDSEVVDALLQFVAVYPTGTKVRLSNEAVGIVVSQNENFPDRLNVKVLTNLGEDIYPKDEVIDLLKTLNLVITDVLD